jgi:hypothetical protein
MSLATALTRLGLEQSVCYSSSMSDRGVSGCDDMIWGPYVNYHDVARLQYARLLWRNPETKRRLLAHWLNPDHPGRDRFVNKQGLLENLLSTDQSDAVIDSELRQQGLSLRTLAREIPPVFGDSY